MIDMKDLCLSFDQQLILNHASLSIPSNGIYALMGASGAGKTSLLRLIAGLIQADSGIVSIPKTKRIGILFQEDRLLPWYNVLKNVMLAMEHPSKEEALDFLQALEIDDASVYPEVLSGGMKRRVALARVLAYKPDIVLMDEPFTGIHKSLIERIIPFVKKSADLILFSTHNLYEVKMMEALKIITIQDGKLL